MSQPIEPNTVFVKVLMPFTRRKFMKRVGLTAAAVAAATLTGVGLRVPPAYAMEGCRFCAGPCSSCYTSVPQCCSPNGMVCYYGPTCVCSAWEQYGQYCSPPCLFAWMNVCDDGSWTGTCTACC